MLRLSKSRKDQFLAECLLEAIQDENFNNVQRLVGEHSVDGFTIIRERGIAAIHYAAGMDNVSFAEKVVKLLLTDDPAIKQKINIQTDDGETVLHVAAFWGRTEICRWLLLHGANIRIQDGDKLSPLDCAINEGHFHIVRIFQDYIFEIKVNPTDRPTLKKRTPNVLQVPNRLTESGLFTPNRINYNFDVTSPYYINITHRRKCWSTPVMQTSVEKAPSWLKEATPKKQTREPINSASSDDDIEPIEVVKTVPRNLFELTKENLRHFTVITDADGEASSRMSLVERWRGKVNHDKRQTICPADLDELPSILDSFDVVNSAQDSAFNEKLSSTRNSELPLSAGHDEQNETNDVLYETANDESRIIKSPKQNKDYLYQVTEEYIHSDVKTGINIYERKVYSEKTIQEEAENTTTASTEFTIPLDYDTDVLRTELTQFGAPPGPIAATTKRLYLKRLVRFKHNPELVARQQAVQLQNGQNSVFSWELERTIRRDDWQKTIVSYMESQTKLVDHFCSQNLKKTNLREGHRKTSFIYLLVDPRITENLPGESLVLTKLATWEAFLRAIFYVGKGKNSRPYSHLYDAIKLYQQINQGDINDVIVPLNARVAVKRRLYECSPSKLDNVKLRRIIDIWKSGKGVVCLHVFHNIMPEDAMTREASIIDAIGVENLTNMKRGDYYGISKAWTMRERKQLGVALLYKSMQVLLAEGESQLRPHDIL